MISALRSLASIALGAAGLLLAPVAPAGAQQFIANQIEKLISSETMQVEIEGLSGALSGAVRIESVTVSDPDGVFLTASDLAMDWSPLALARANIQIESLTAGQITLTRLPTGGAADPDAEGGGFSLPSITADIGQIAIAEFVLGEAVAGVAARLSATASLTLASEPVRLDLSADIQRLDQPGQIALNLAFAPDANELVVNVQANEPAGGVVAGLLKLPGAPPVSLSVSGTGPLSQFSANGTLDIAEERAITLSANVADGGDGRRVNAQVSTITGPFVPEQYVDIVGDSADLSVNVLLRNDGAYVIDQGTLTSGNLQLEATGTFDRAGAGTDLRLVVATPEGAPIPLAFGEAGARTLIEVSWFDADLTGALSALVVQGQLVARTAGFEDYIAREATVRLSSEGFNVEALTGPFAVEADIVAASAPTGIAANVLQGPITLRAAGSLAENALTLTAGNVTTAVANAAVTGTAALNFSTFDIALATDFATSALAEAAVPYAGERVSVAGNVQRTPEGNLAAQNLVVDGEGLDISGSASLSGETLAAAITGTLDQAANPQTDFSGRADFALNASGTLQAPVVDLTASAATLLVAGRELSDLDARIQGTFAPDAPRGTVAVNGTYDGEPLAVGADFETGPDEVRAFRNLLIRQGDNNLSGELTLDRQNRPAGRLAIAAPDISTLAALFGQEAEGDVEGEAVLAIEGDVPVADLDIRSGSLTVAENVLTGAAIDLRLTDYLLAPRATGTIAAGGLVAGSLTVDDLDVELTAIEDATTVDASVDINTVPTTFVGDLSLIETGVRIALRELTAAIEDAAIELQAPAVVEFGNGATNLGEIALVVGDGSLTASGTIREGLDLDIAIDALPLAIANPFVEGLDAAGSLTGSIETAGSLDNPRADFTLTADALETSQTRAANLPAVNAQVAGQYRGGTTTLATAFVDLGEGSITATGSVGDTLDLQVALSAIPVALANGFVDGLNATGTIEGNAEATGPIDNPNVTFTLSGDGITAPEIAESGIEPFTLDVAGTLRNGTLQFERALADLGQGEIRATGSVGRNLDLDLALQAVPVAIANGFVPGLDAMGTLDGSASVDGSLAAPTAQFSLNSTNISATPLRASGIAAVRLALAGSYADAILSIDTAEIDTGRGSLSARGTVGDTLDLDLTLATLPLALANAVSPDLGAEGTISGTASAEGALADPTATFDLTVAGASVAQTRAGGVAPLDAVVQGTYADGSATLTTANVDVGTGSVSATGTVGQTLDLDVTIDTLPLALANGFVPDLDAQGTLSGTASANGALTDPTATFDLTISGASVAQTRAGDVAPLDAVVQGSYADGSATLTTANVDVGTGSVSATGTVGQALDLDVAIEALPLALANGFVPDLDAQGALSGTASANGALNNPTATFDLTISGASVAQTRAGNVAPLDAVVQGSYADGSATLTTANVDVGTGSVSATGTVGQTLDLDVVLDSLPLALANGFVADLGAEGTLSGTASANGALTNPTATFDLTISGASVAQTRAGNVAPLDAVVQGSYADGSATLTTANVDVGTGSVSATGTVGQTLDLDVVLDSLPLALANGFVADLGAEGTLSGTASASGPLTDPAAQFDLSAAGISVAQTRDLDLPPLTAAAAGTYGAGSATLQTARIDIGGGTITATGTVGEMLDVDVTLAGIQALLLAAVAPDVAPEGVVAGTVQATGSISDPSVAYDLSVSGLSVAQTRSVGLGALAITADGTYAGDTVTLDATLGGAGLDFSASGSVGLAGTPSFDVALNGTAPLSVANGILAEGGRSVQGTVTADLQVSGTAASPNVVGTVSTSGAQFVDTGANLVVEGITTTIAFSGQTATFQSFSAQLGAGGTIDVGGTIGIGEGFPADLTITVDGGRYADGELLTTVLDARLTITGPLTGSPLLAGTVDAREINVLVPDTLPASLARIDVTHVNAPPAVYRQNREINPDTGSSGNSSTGINLDLTLNAPNRVFVRGRGLDLELGGSIRVTGSISSPSIVGGFELQRGRFQILSRRLDFERATLSFSGDLLPTLDLVAVSQADSVTVRIAITGPANDPSFSFSSTPALPQDEVLARLIFGQATTDLSPLQIAQLASAAAQLAGVGGSTGLLENLRAQLGVDDLDIRTNADGQTAVGVGRYINDNTYVGVDSTGRVSIDLELGANVKARAAVSATGGGEVGIFYEREY